MLATRTCILQFVREFAKLGLTRSVGGVLGLALSRELTPVITSIILAGQLHSGLEFADVMPSHEARSLVIPEIICNLPCCPF